MSVKIRLRRIGRKKQPYYRVVVVDSRSPRDGAYLDTVGFYNPNPKPAELRMDLDKVEAWTGKGADMSDTVRSLVRKARKGGDDKIALMAPAEVAAETPAEAPKATARKAKGGKPETAAAPAAAAEPDSAEAETEPAPPATEPDAE